MLQSLQDMARALQVRFGPHAQQFPEGELDDLLLKPRTAAQPLDPHGRARSLAGRAARAIAAVDAGLAAGRFFSLAMVGSTWANCSA